MRLAVCCKEGLFGESLTCLLDTHPLFHVVAKEQQIKELILSAKREAANILVVEEGVWQTNDLQFLLGAKAIGSFAIVLVAEDANVATYADLSLDLVIPKSASASKLFDSLGELAGSVAPSSKWVVREQKRLYGDKAVVLSDREFECAQLVAQGLGNRKIAQITGLQEQSVKNMVSVIMRKLGCANRVQVALMLSHKSVRP